MPKSTLQIIISFFKLGYVKCKILAFIENIFYKFEMFLMNRSQQPRQVVCLTLLNVIQVKRSQ